MKAFEDAAKRIYHEGNDGWATTTSTPSPRCTYPTCTFESPAVLLTLNTESGICRGIDEPLPPVLEQVARTPALRTYHWTGYLTDGSHTVIFEYPRDAPDGEQMGFVEAMEIGDGLIRPAALRPQGLARHQGHPRRRLPQVADPVVPQHHRSAGRPGRLNELSIGGDCDAPFAGSLRQSLVKGRQRGMREQRCIERAAVWEFEASACPQAGQPHRLAVGSLRNADTHALQVVEHLLSTSSPDAADEHFGQVQRMHQEVFRRFVPQVLAGRHVTRIVRRQVRDDDPRVKGDHAGQSCRSWSR